MPTLKVPILLLLIFSLYSLTSAEVAKIVDIDINDEVELYLLKGQMQYFKFRVEKAVPGYDLSIIARPFGDNDPELFLSTTEKYPKSKENSEYYSTSVGYSSIYIPSSKIVTSRDYYLGTTCASEVCYFNVTVDLALDHYMRPNIEILRIDYSHTGALVIRSEVPESKDAQHIIFSAELSNIQDVDNGIQMYVNMGNTIPTSSKYDIKATVAWGDGLAAYVFKGDKTFCTKCNYTIALEAPKKSVVIFTRTIHGPNIPTMINTKRNDAVEVNQTVTYAVNITSLTAKEPIVLIEVSPYYGVPYIYANLGTLPKKFDEYRYFAKGKGQEILQVNIDKKPENGLLYVTIFGQSHSTYTIKIYDTDKKSLELTLGEPQVGQIVGETVQSYLVAAEGRKDMKMTFNLHPDQGKIDLFVKSCDKKDDCEFTLEDTQKILAGKIPTSKKRPILQFSNITDGDEVINFDMDGSVCNPNSGSGVPRCYFAVGVLGTEKGKTAKFVITANRNGLHQALRANHPVRDHLLLDQYKYYYFSLNNDQGINSVNFMVTKISGDVSVYISRFRRDPDLNNQENPTHYNDYYSFEKGTFEKLTGTYYIAVKAHTSATYSIVPILSYRLDAWSIGGHYMMRLSEGTPQKMVIDGNNPSYFKFDAFYPPEQKQDIEITLNECQGYFEICVNNDGQFPEQGECQFMANTSTLIIKADQDGYLGVGTHFVGIFPRNVSSGNNQGNSTKAQSFSITWTAIRSFRTVPYAIPIRNWVASNRIVYFKFEVHEDEDKEIIIHESHDSNATVDVYLANSESRLGTDVASFKYNRTTKDIPAQGIKLQEKEIQDLCVHSGSGMVTKCYLYLAVVTDSPNDIQFSLTITKDFDDLRIPEGTKTEYSFPSKEHPIHLYYYPHYLADITILASAYFRNMILYANIIDTTDYGSRREWDFPTKEDHDFVASESMQLFDHSRIFIEAAELSGCGTFDKFRCAIALTMYYETPKEMQDSGLLEYSTFSVIATQEITPIAAGKSIYSSVSEQSYKYFSLHVSKDQATLLFSVNLLSGQRARVLISQGKDERPTMENHEFLFYPGFDLLQLSHSDTRTGSTKGDWVIAVYGDTPCEFVLNVVYENTKMVELSKGLPLNMDVGKDPVFFTYKRGYEEKLNLKLTKQKGSGVISIKQYSVDEIYATKLPTATNGVIYKFDTVQKVISFSDTGLACLNCLYVIGVFADSDIKMSLVLKNPEQFIMLQNNIIFTDYAQNKVYNMYEFRNWDMGVNLDVNLVVYSGQPKVYVSHNPTVNETNHLWYYNQTNSKNYIRLALNNSKYEDKELPPVWNGKQNVSSHNYVYYIMVTAPINSNYSIAVTTSNTTRYPFDGYQEFGFLNPGEFNNYRYYVSPDKIGKSEFFRFKLQFIIHKDQFSNINETLEKPNITVIAVSRSIMNVTLNKTIKPEPDLQISPVREDISTKSYGDQNYIMNLQYIIKKDKDILIIVNNTGKTHLNYSLTVNSHEPVLLSMNNLYSSRLSLNEKEVFEVHPGHAGLLVVEIHECIGKVKVQFSKTPTLAGAIKDAKDSSLLASSLGSHISLASLEIDEPRTIYVILTAIDGVQDDEFLPDIDAIYKIKVNLFAMSNFLPFMNLAPGNDGLLQWDVTDKGKLRFGFSPVKNLAYNQGIKSTQFGQLDIKFQYEFFLTKNISTGNFLSRCDMLPGQKGAFKDIDLYSKKIVLDQKNAYPSSPANPDLKYIEVDPDTEYDDLYATMRVTVFSLDKNGHPVWDYPIIYQPVEVRNIRRSANGFIIFILGTCLVMLTLAIIGVMYYYSKFQRVRQKLNYEMQDLRNLATTVESFDARDVENLGKSKGGYGHLIEEEA